MHSVESPERESPQCELLGAIVLAGGTARRMGGVSKPDVEVGGKSLLIRAVEEIRASAPDAHIVVVAPPGVRIPDGVTRVLEDPPLGGPAAGVAAGWHVLATRGPYDPEAHVALLTCDAPLAPRLYPQLDAVLTVAVSAPATDDVATGGTVPVIEDDSGEPHSQYLHGVYVAAALDQLLSGDVRERSVRSLFRQLSVLEVPDQERWGIDVDTWDDVHALEARLAD